MGPVKRRTRVALAVAAAILATTATETAAATFGAPTAHTGAATAVTSSTATLQGTVNDQFEPTTYHFEYGTANGYDVATPTTSSGSDDSDHAVTADLSGLNPATTYHFRLVATNSSGTTHGSDETFTTAPVAPGQATLIGAPRASARGVVVTLACAGGTCSGRVGLLALERLSGRRIVGVLPVDATGSPHSRSVLVGLKRYSVGDGTTRQITVPLNGLGQRLAGAFKRVPLQVVIAVDAPRGYQGAIITRRVAYRSHR